MANNVLISVEIVAVTCIYTLSALFCILCVCYWFCHRCKRVFKSKVNIRMGILTIITLIALSVVPITLWLFLIEYFIDWSKHSDIGLIDIIHFYDSHSLSVQFYITVISYPISKYLTWILLFLKWHDSFAYTPLQSSKQQYRILLMLLSINIVPLLLGLYHLCFLNIDNIVGYAAGILWFVLDLIYSVVLAYFFISKLILVAKLDPMNNKSNNSKFALRKSKSSDHVNSINSNKNKTTTTKPGLPKSKSVGFVISKVNFDQSHSSNNNNNNNNNNSTNIQMYKGRNEKQQFEHVSQVSQPIDKLMKTKVGRQNQQPQNHQRHQSVQSLQSQQSPQLAQIPQKSQLAQDSITPQHPIGQHPIPLVASVNSVSYHKSQESGIQDINLQDLSRLTQSHESSKNNNNNDAVVPPVHERVRSSSVQSHTRQDSTNNPLEHGFHIELQSQFCPFSNFTHFLCQDKTSFVTTICLSNNFENNN